jgi:hypothetical protein
MITYRGYKVFVEQEANGTWSGTVEGLMVYAAADTYEQGVDAMKALLDAQPLRIYEADDPLVLNGTYDREGYKPGERALIAKQRARQQQEDSMAKKPAKKKAPAGPKFPKKKAAPARKAKPAFRGADSRKAARPKGPRSQALPGMAQVRDAKLDQICEDIGEGLDQINDGTEQVNDGKAAAIARLHARGLSGYRHAGVRLSLVPGAEKVSVKREKDREVTLATGAGETTQTTEAEPGEGYTGEGEDLGGGEGEGGEVH